MIAVIVNGLPGAGKTTLSGRLSKALSLPLFSKDAVKETIADVIGVTPPVGSTRADWNRTLGAASSEVLWTLLGASPCGGIIESPYLAHVRAFAVAGLQRAGVALGDVHEVWCDVSPAVARARIAERAPRRHPIHHDDRDKSAEWDYWVTVAEPLGFGTLYRVDTSDPVTDGEVGRLAAAIDGR